MERYRSCLGGLNWSSGADLGDKERVGPQESRCMCLTNQLTNWMNLLLLDSVHFLMHMLKKRTKKQRMKSFVQKVNYTQNITNMQGTLSPQIPLSHHTMFVFVQTLGCGPKEGIITGPTIIR